MKTTKILKGVAIAAMTLSLTGCMGLGNSLGNVNIAVGDGDKAINAECVATVNFKNDSNCNSKLYIAASSFKIDFSRAIFPSVLNKFCAVPDSL